MTALVDSRLRRLERAAAVGGPEEEARLLRATGDYPITVWREPWWWKATRAYRLRVEVVDGNDTLVGLFPGEEITLEELLDLFRQYWEADPFSPLIDTLFDQASDFELPPQTPIEPGDLISFRGVSGTYTVDSVTVTNYVYTMDEECPKERARQEHRRNCQQAFRRPPKRMGRGRAPAKRWGRR
jgi:hypothetical protein